MSGLTYNFEFWLFIKRWGWWISPYYDEGSPSITRTGCLWVGKIESWCQLVWRMSGSWMFLPTLEMSLTILSFGDLSQFNNFLLGNTSFMEVVRDSWVGSLVEGWMACILRVKLKALKGRLKVCNIDEYVFLDFTIQRYVDKIEFW